jgi:hypothetical protein
MDELILFVAVVTTLIAVYFVVQFVKTRLAEKRARKERQEEALRRLEKMREESWAKVRRVNSEPIKAAVKNTQAVPNRISSTPTPTPSYVPSATQSVQSSRSVLDDVADIAMIANTVRHWNDNDRTERVEEPVREERSAGVSKTESSWGFDDSDSRKSVSDTFSSSWSSSSSDSSSSWSSSSDSGPSSDW